MMIKKDGRVEWHDVIEWIYGDEEEEQW